MVLLRILSGSQTGGVHEARRFPVSIGRASGASLRLADKGVWDQHLELNFTPAGFRLRLCPGALATINDEPFTEAALRNGDRIALGSVTLQFWLAEARQGSYAAREALTWIALAALAAGEVGLIAWLLQ